MDLRVVRFDTTMMSMDVTIFQNSVPLPFHCTNKDYIIIIITVSCASEQKWLDTVRKCELT